MSMAPADASIVVRGAKLDSPIDPWRPRSANRPHVWCTHAPGRRPGGTIEPGSVGYRHYHDHVVGTGHGTGGSKPYVTKRGRGQRQSKPQLSKCRPRARGDEHRSGRASLTATTSAPRPRG
ncbi:hypothetical protein [Microbispora hainanensis]|uniref:hypothetical protein n=1 Tax=Microbispora hainanensis TaxID=568844 RepID=UPI00325512F2